MVTDDVGGTADSAASLASLPEDLLLEVVCDVLYLRTNLDISSSIAHAAPTELSGWRLDALGIDSLMIAEIVVELEQRLDTFLELSAYSRMETLADLSLALQPVATG